MLQNPKTKKVLIIGYIVFLIFGVFYVRSIVKSASVDVSQKSVEKKAPEVKEANVTLIVQNGTQTTEYKHRGKSADSVIDLFEELRSDQNFTYQTVEYTYGTELESVNGVKAAPNQKWKLFDGNIDITNSIHDVKLLDNKVYTLRLQS